MRGFLCTLDAVAITDRLPRDRVAVFGLRASTKTKCITVHSSVSLRSSSFAKSDASRRNQLNQSPYRVTIQPSIRLRTPLDRPINTASHRIAVDTNETSSHVPRHRSRFRALRREGLHLYESLRVVKVTSR